MLGLSGYDDEELALQVPSDGSVKSLRAVLDRLADELIDVASLSIHTPDLDDVFLTLTGHSGTDHSSTGKDLPR